MVGDDGQVYLSGAPLSGELLEPWGTAQSWLHRTMYCRSKATASRHCYFGSLHTSWLIKEIINKMISSPSGDGMFVSGKHILGYCLCK
ncbi:hypothetical protein ACLB1N_02245 [Escherichia coli]